MRNLDQVIKSAIVGVLALAVVTPGIATAKQSSVRPMEKCYGIVKAGMNDCQTSSASCAGSAKKDNQPDAFVFLPKGICNKIVGGKLSPPAKHES